MVRSLASEYSLPEWCADALVALCGAAQSRLGAPGGISSLFSSGGAATQLRDVLSETNVSGFVTDAGLSEEYDDAVQHGNVTAIAVVLTRAANVSGVSELLGVTLGRVALVVSTATELHGALRDEDVLRAVRALVAAAGQQDEPIGQAIMVVVRGCLSSRPGPASCASPRSSSS